MNKSVKQKPEDENETEKKGKEIFEKIGLKCFGPSGQVPINNLRPGYKEGTNIEIDYLVPEKKVCLIGEITARNNEKDIREKYKRFIDVFNLLKTIDLSSENTWKTLGISPENIRDFREVENIKGFFITTTKEKGDVKLDNIEGMAVFYQSDFTRLSNYSEMIGKWTKNFFLNNFSFYHSTNNAITIYETENCLIRHTYRNISKKEKDTPLSDLYTFAISPYELLDIAHVYRRDELPSLETCPYNYQRTLDNQKMEEIRKTLLINKDFTFPSNILVVLSQECEYRDQKDKSANYLLIPRKYGNISVIDGQHRLFSYANDKIKSQIGDDCKIIVTAVQFKTDDHKLIGKSSAQIFIEINSNQTKIEISHLDHISYELGNDDPKVIATRILVEINNRQKFNHFFDIKLDKLDKSNKKMVEAKTIINKIKKISSLRTIQGLQNPRSDIKKRKKTGYESLFGAKIPELSNRESLLKEGVILFERNFNLIFKIFKKDTEKSDISTSFSYTNFWGGWIKLLAVFIDEGLNWESVENELEKIKQNVMKLRGVDEYKAPLFDPKDKRFPSSNRTGESYKFLYYNREKPVSVQELNL